LSTAEAASRAAHQETQTAGLTLPEGKPFPVSRHAGLNKARQRLEDHGSEFAVEDNITIFIFQ